MEKDFEPKEEDGEKILIQQRSIEAQSQGMPKKGSFI